MDRFVCVNCGFTVSEKDMSNFVMSCPSCGNHLQVEFSKDKYDPSVLSKHSTSDSNKPLFTGSPGEYFRIWIVNTLFTLLTLGIYAAWAKVRNRQYFYKNTILGNQPFEYLANPFAILKGNLIIGTGILLYYFSSLYNPVYSLIVVAVFYMTVPFLIYKSLRFYAHNSSFRNIRFRFLGTLGESYKVYLLLPLLAPFTLGLILPYWVYRQKKYFFDNFALGTTENSFEGRTGPFYKIYLSVFMLSIAILSATVFLTSSPMSFSSLSTDPENLQGSQAIKMVIIIYIVTLFLITFIQQYLYAWQSNYCWGHSTLGNLRFQSTLKGSRLFWIRLTNMAAIILSLGLLIPWAKVRRYRYILNNMTVYSDQSMDDFYSSSEPDESALGDSATDFFDFEIGL
jgi:uncharacterized membrane protein YjgN (DUF898 family)